jgi:large subunit ribosomal protein L6
MSRIGNLPVAIPDGVKVDLSKDNCLTVTGKLGELKQKIDPSIEVVIEDKQIILKRTSEQKQVKSYHGLYRSLVNNMVFGVSTGYTTVQELVGVGYKAEAKGQLLELQLSIIFLQGMLIGKQDHMVMLYNFGGILIRQQMERQHAGI